MLFGLLFTPWCVHWLIISASNFFSCLAKTVIQQFDCNRFTENNISCAFIQVVEYSKFNFGLHVHSVIY